MRKQITSLLLTLAMLLSLVPTLGVTASAAEDDTSYSQAEIRDYATFATYLRSFDSRDLKLMEDIDYTVGINDLSIDVMCNQKLDLNGHKIRIDASKRAGFENLLCIRRGEFTLYDSSKGGGGDDDDSKPVNNSFAITSFKIGDKAAEIDNTNGIIKISPLAHWSEEDVWNYIRAYGIPYNPLHDAGFPSIGCACCTRAVKRTEDVRDGRWWWEEKEHRECGLHRRPRH